MHGLSQDIYGIFAVVLTPTRELAHQIGEQFSLIGAPISTKTAVIVGGTQYLHQTSQLDKKPHVVVATPGRLAEHLKKNKQVHECFSRVKYLVIDEADRLFSTPDFIEQMQVIFDCLPKERKTLLFSATITEDIKTIQDVSSSKPFIYNQNEM